MEIVFISGYWRHHFRKSFILSVPFQWPAHGSSPVFFAYLRFPSGLLLVRFACTYISPIWIPFFPFTIHCLCIVLWFFSFKLSPNWFSFHIPACQACFPSALIWLSSSLLVDALKTCL